MVIVHAPNIEKIYIEKGVLHNHTIIAYNYFVLVGPKNDPANASRADSMVEAFRRIYKAGIEGRALFVTRGDCSGTYVRERIIWSKAGLDPRPSRDAWYLSTGQSMATTLRIADEKRAYTLSDIGTYTLLKSKGAIVNLAILYPTGTEKDPLLLNIYSAYIVSTCRGRQLEAAKLFLKFLGTEGQEIIESFRVNGVQLFHPAASASLNLTRYWIFLSRLETPLECRR